MVEIILVERYLCCLDTLYSIVINTYKVNVIYSSNYIRRCTLTLLTVKLTYKPTKGTEYFSS
jgi:hypothetical protein